MAVLRFPFTVALAMVALVGGLSLLPGPTWPPLPQRAGPPLTAALSWGYQLQGPRPELIPPEIDLVVIDHARDASATDLLSAADVDRFRQRPGAPPRIVLAYMSIGEAETYRAYWWKPWVSKAYLGLLRPGWLGRENKEWKGNYLVRYWETGWQKLIVNPAPSRLDAIKHAWLGAPRPYIDKILEAGFDGVYLDRVDAFSAWEKSHTSAEADMSAFVARISAYAKARKAGFLIVPQNGEELTARADYVRAIDGLAKEDVLFGIDGSTKANPPAEVTHTVETLSRARQSGLPVFVVEYVASVDQRVRAQRRMAELGFTLTFADRALDTPPVFWPPLPPLPPPVSAVAPAIPRAPATAKPQP